MAIAFDCIARPAEAHRRITDLVADQHGGCGMFGGPTNSRVQELLSAAAELEPTDARAFMLALDQAFRKSVRKSSKPKDVDASKFAPTDEEEA